MTDTNDVADWWRTRIIDMEPGRITLRGHPVQELIGTIGFAPMIRLMVMGDKIEGPRARPCSRRPWFRRSIMARKPLPLLRRAWRRPVVWVCNRPWPRG